MPRTLLLADDSVVIQKLVGLSFANEDVELITVDNGDDAIDQARAARPDLVLADVVMPGKSGYDVCAAIKQTPELSSTPVLLLTGTFEAFDDERAAQVGATGHITKPFEAQALVERVKAVLAEAPAAAPATAAPDLAIGGGDAFDFFDETNDGAQAAAGTAAPAPPLAAPAAAPPEAATPAVDALTELAMPAPTEDPLATSATPAVAADPGATMLVDDLFEAGAVGDGIDSVPEITPPSPNEIPIAPAALGDVDLFGDDPQGNTTPTLDTGNNSGPLDLDLSLGGLDLSQDPSSGSARDATIAILPEDRPHATPTPVPVETAAPASPEPKVGGPLDPATSADPLAALAAPAGTEDSEVLLETPAAEAAQPVAPIAALESSQPAADAQPPNLVQDDRFDISSSDLDDAMAVRPAQEATTPSRALDRRDRAARNGHARRGAGRRRADLGRAADRRTLRIAGADGRVRRTRAGDDGRAACRSAGNHRSGSRRSAGSAHVRRACWRSVRGTGFGSAAGRERGDAPADPRCAREGRLGSLLRRVADDRSSGTRAGREDRLGSDPADDGTPDPGRDPAHEGQRELLSERAAPLR